MVVAVLFAALAGAKLVSAGADSYQVNGRCNIDQLMRGFSSDTGLWGNNWWTGASMLTAVNDYAYLDDSANSFKHVYGHIWDDVLNNAPHHNPGRKRRSALNKRDGDYSGFLNDYYDDEGWWVLALVGSYDNTHNQAHLDAAKEIWADINASFDTHECGGIPWKRTDSGPLSIPNSLFITASASIANRVSSDDRGQYLDAALEGWKWFDDAGVINDNNLVTDGVDGDCKPNGAIYTYNQGSIIGGLVELATATGDDSYLDTAADIADAVIADGSPLVDDGILVDGCDRSHNCDGNGVAFKGVFARNLRRLQAVRPQDRYRDFLTKNAQSIWNNDLGIDDGGACNNGPYWAGPYSDDDKSTVAQAVALDALTAAWAVTK